jgi:hypothetical protein
MAMTFADLQSALFARGFDFMNDAGAGLARAKVFLNLGMHICDDAESWQYLQASTTGTAPVTVSDLGRIESVVDVTNLNPLEFMSRRDVTNRYADLSLTGGFPAFYFVTGGNTVGAFPVTSVTLTVRYTRVAPDMVAGTDVPLMPDRFRMAIVDYAAALAFRESNVPDEAQIAQAAGDAVVERMREWDVLSQGSGGRQFVTGASGDW